MSESTTKEKVVEKIDSQTNTYEKPEVKTLCQRDIVQAVSKGSKFPARGFAG
jgi:hypothetical protein